MYRDAIFPEVVLAKSKRINIELIFYVCSLSPLGHLLWRGGTHTDIAGYYLSGGWTCEKYWRMSPLEMPACRRRMADALTAALTARIQSRCDEID